MRERLRREQNNGKQRLIRAKFHVLLKNKTSIWFLIRFGAVTILLGSLFHGFVILSEKKFCLTGVSALFVFTRYNEFRRKWYLKI